jgi:virulence-associated protein VapD
MENKKEIIALKRAYRESTERIERIGRDRVSGTVHLSEQIIEWITELEAAREKEKSLGNVSVNVRIKVVKKSIRHWIGSAG